MNHDTITKQIEEYFRMAEGVVSPSNENIENYTPHQTHETEYFDLSSDRLNSLFLSLSKESIESSAIITQNVLLKGIEECGIIIRNKTKYQTFLEKIVGKKDSPVKFIHFLIMIQTLKIAALLVSQQHCSDIVSQSLDVNVKDFDAYELKEFQVTKYNLKDFIYTLRSKVSYNRWINVDLPSPFVLKLLCVKYRLHPLVLEDIVNNKEQTRAKVDVYENHLLISVPVLTADVQDFDGNIENYGTFGAGVMTRRSSLFSRTHSFNPVQLQQVHVSTSSNKNWYERLFTSSSDDYQELEEFDLEGNENFEETFIVPDGFKVPKIHKVNSYVLLSRKDFKTIITAVDSQNLKGDLFERLAQELQLSYSKTRSSNCFYLFYVFMSTLVDSYFVVISELEKCLLKVKVSVRNLSKINNKAKLTKLSSLYHDLLSECSKVQRWLMPLQRVLNNMVNGTIEKEMEEETRLHLSDVLDNLQQVLDDVQAIMESARHIKEEHKQAVETNMTRTMTALTLIATIFLPAQFLTGVFGMNFEDMPELHWRWGYPLFWGVCILSWICLYFMFKKCL